jgi:hypothetical protein
MRDDVSKREMKKLHDFVRLCCKQMNAIVISNQKRAVIPEEALNSVVLLVID